MAHVFGTYFQGANMHPRAACLMQNVANLDDSVPCVALASPGMLQSGSSRELFERWCQDAKNSLIIAGYAVQGTLASELKDEPKEVQSTGECMRAAPKRVGQQHGC